MSHRLNRNRFVPPNEYAAIHTGERRRGAIECEIFQTHIQQEAESAANFLEHFLGDELARFIEL